MKGLSSTSHEAMIRETMIHEAYDSRGHDS